MARILVVDDDEADRVVLSAILERAGHDVLIAQDGQDALDQLALAKVDAVVTDLQMRNVHGLELITILRDREPRPGIIAISGTGEVQLEMAHAVGAERTLTKPVRPDDLLSAVSEVVADAG